MLIWGSIGLLTKFVELSPVVLAFYRALISIPVLLILYAKSKEVKKMTRKDLLLYILSGVFMAGAWLTLFASFSVTNISLAILIYNMCPVYVMFFSPMVLGEKSDNLQKLTIVMSFIGLSLLIGENIVGKNQMDIGVLYALFSGLFYAGVVMINRKIENSYSPNKVTLIQVLTATVFLLPFTIFEGGPFQIIKLPEFQVFLVIVLGVIHTGIAYVVYFSTYKYLRAIEIVSYSYLEPLFSIALGVVFLKERLSVIQIIGCLLVLGFTYYNEFRKSRSKYNEVLEV